MDYLKHYIKLIHKRQCDVLDYKGNEKHHIIPKSISNTSFIYEKLKFDNNDVVILSLREHYIAHALLVKICQENKNCYIRMLYAYNIMKNRSSYEYSLYKSQYSKMLSEEMTGKPSRAKGKK